MRQTLYVQHSGVSMSALLCPSSAATGNRFCPPPPLRGGATRLGRSFTDQRECCCKVCLSGGGGEFERGSEGAEIGFFPSTKLLQGGGGGPRARIISEAKL